MGETQYLIFHGNFGHIVAFADGTTMHMPVDASQLSIPGNILDHGPILAQPDTRVGHQDPAYRYLYENVAMLLYPVAVQPAVLQMWYNGYLPWVGMPTAPMAQQPDFCKPEELPILWPNETDMNSTPQVGEPPHLTFRPQQPNLFVPGDSLDVSTYMYSTPQASEPPRLTFRGAFGELSVPVPVSKKVYSDFRPLYRGLLCGPDTRIDNRDPALRHCYVEFAREVYPFEMIHIILKTWFGE